MEISLTEKIFLYLLNCAVNERIPEELPSDIDFEELFRLSRFHSVAAMVSYALDKGGYLTDKYMPQELVQKWASARISAIRKNIMFDAEREQILKYMEEHGIWYMPLKGVILKEMYPDVGMREMCDNDILFDGNYRKQMRDYMVERGYEVPHYEKYVDEAYRKKPFYNFELHTSLFEKKYYDHWVKYYENVKEHLCKDENREYGYHFKDEDFYIYITAHTYKHYRVKGTGIRSFTDIYVYLKKKECSLDWEYIEQETAKIGIDIFERDVRTLAKHQFAPSRSMTDFLSENEKEAAMISYILNAGTYGTLENKIVHDVMDLQIDKEKCSFKVKLIYFMKRVCPNRESIKDDHPFLYKHQWLIPFFWIYRLINRPLRNWKRLLKELKTLINLK